jgi:hypothetical protein
MTDKIVLNNSEIYFKSPTSQVPRAQNSPILQLPKTNNTKILIHNYQNVLEGENGPEIQTNCITSTANTTEEDKSERIIPGLINKEKKIIINGSPNFFTQMNEMTQLKLASSLIKAGRAIEPQQMVMEQASNDILEAMTPGLFPPPNSVTNIFINYTFEKNDQKLLGRKKVREADSEECLTFTTRIFNLQEVRIMRKKIDRYFSQLEDYNLEIIEPLYSKKFAYLNGGRTITTKPETKEHADISAKSVVNTSQPDMASNNIAAQEPQSKALLDLEEDALAIQRKICLDELRALILTIQEGYIFKKKKSPCKDLIAKSAYYIDEINRISEKLNKTQIITCVKKPKFKNFKKSFKCDFCECTYTNGQALGGHMSRSHPNQSKKYNMKKMVRQEREVYRDLIFKARLELFANHHLNYEELVKSKENKPIIRKIRKENMKEYKDILDRLKKKYN